MLRIVTFCKDILVVSPLILILRPFIYMFGLLYYTYKLNRWISHNKNKFIFKTPYRLSRRYEERNMLYEKVIAKDQLDNADILYLEFGVCGGESFRWWLAHNSSPHSLFFGFDTFEGLPEDWGGFFKKGDMAAPIPQVDDQRATFVKGLFQDTLHPFITAHHDRLTSRTKKVIHMDADLYSATAFTLSQLYPYLHKGDMIIFDEFSVPLHEFKAFDEFTNNFYIRLIPIVAVNNYIQMAFEVE